MDLRQNEAQPRNGPGDEDVGRPKPHVCQSQKEGDERSRQNEEQPYRLYRVLRVGIRNGDDRHPKRIVRDCEQKQVVDCWMASTEYQDRKHPGQGDVCCSGHSPAIHDVCKHALHCHRRNLLRGPRQETVASIDCRISYRLLAHHAIQRAQLVENQDCDYICGHRPEHAPESGHQGVRCSPNGAQGTSRKQGLCHLFYGKAKKEAHEDVVDQEMYARVMPHNLPARDDRIMRCGPITVLIHVLPYHGNDDAQHQRQGVLLHDSHDSPHVLLHEWQLVGVVARSVMMHVVKANVALHAGDDISILVHGRLLPHPV
mmetsp:Transcript_41174/g.95691  ORF Transcript_41174/g.95691 Transcript_41174/m.95691 type:complete len:314 (-) Transcript_41174:614-1555(-)